MIEEYLIQYGVLGLWTGSLLIEKHRTLNKMIKILEEIKNIIRSRR